MSDAELIPAKFADFFWNEEPGNIRTGGPEVLVLNRDPGRFPRDRASDPTHLDSSHGSMVMGWMEDGHPLHNPAGLFAHNWLSKGSSPASIEAALRQIAKIEECTWAREMIAAIDWRRAREEE